MSIHKKKLCGPLFVSLSSNYGVFLLRVFHIGSLDVLYQNMLLIECDRFMARS